MQQLNAFGRLDKPASVVLFAGLGGSCEGIRMATGTSPIAAINHNPAAIRLHARNHPETMHALESVWNVQPLRLARGRKIKLVWLSPDCTHHSKAKGSAPRESGRRALADAIFMWIEDCKPSVIMLENVPEWLDWGPVDEDGMPIKERKGELFREWLSKVQSHGYTVEWRVLEAHKYGVPTSRKRVYLVARCDGRPIVWPEPTHGPGLIPYRTAAECIDWSLPSLSIFATPEEARAWAKQHGLGVPRRPLEEATLKRVAAGLVKYVLENPKPFIIHHRGQSVGRGLDEPMPTVTATEMGHLGIVSPHILCLSHGGRSEDVTEPLNTITSTPKGGDRVLVSAWIAKHYGGIVGHGVDRPLGTITTTDHHSLCTATLSATEEAGARKVAAFLCAYYGCEKDGQAITSPLRAVTCTDRFGLVTVTLEGQPYVVVDISMRMLQPRELARAMGFPDSYRLEGSKAEQVRGIGNAVCPQMAEVLVRANL